MEENQSYVKNLKLLDNLLSKRMEFGQAKQEYINSIKEFCRDAISHVRIKFHENKMYVTFESWCPFDDKYLLKFCNEFGFLAPTVKIIELNGSFTIYKWEFIKIL